MQQAPYRRPRPYGFENLPSLTRNEVSLWNWYSSIGPSGAEWKAWVAEIFSHLVERPSDLKFGLVQTHLVDSRFGEKVLSFGSKQEIFLGRGPENDVVLSANAIATRHARILKEDRAYLEDLGSQLGIYLWDKKLPPKQVQVLRHGDQFTIFPYRFRAQLEPGWTPEADAMVSESTISPLSRIEFLESSPAKWPVFVVRSHPADREALLQVSPNFLASLQQRMLAPLRIDKVSPPVPSDDALLEFLVLAALEHVNRRVRFPMQFSLASGRGKRSTDNARGLLLGFAVGVGGLTGQFRIFLPFDFIFSDKVVRPADWEPSYPSGLSWSLPVSAGFVDLSADEMSQIALGDVVVAQAAPALLFPNDFRKGWMIAQEASNSRRFRVDKYFERSAPVEAGGEEQAATSKPDIKALPLRVQVVLAEREFSLGEIQSLSPGTIVELDTAKNDPVRLMVNGKIIGEGELVDVEGNLAVKILRWRTS